MVGGTVSRVAVSQHPDFNVGDWVLGYDGWQDYALSDGSGLRNLGPPAAPFPPAGRAGHAGVYRLHGIARYRPTAGG